MAEGLLGRIVSAPEDRIRISKNPGKLDNMYKTRVCKKNTRMP